MHALVFFFPISEGKEQAVPDPQLSSNYLSRRGQVKILQVWEKISVYRSKICFLHNERKAKNTLTNVTIALQTEPLRQTALTLLVLVGIPLVHHHEAEHCNRGRAAKDKRQHRRWEWGCKMKSSGLQFS